MWILILFMSCRIASGSWTAQCSMASFSSDSMMHVPYSTAYTPYSVWTHRCDSRGEAYFEESNFRVLRLEMVDVPIYDEMASHPLPFSTPFWLHVRVRGLCSVKVAGDDLEMADMSSCGISHVINIPHRFAFARSTTLDWTDVLIHYDGTRTWRWIEEQLVDVGVQPPPSRVVVSSDNLRATRSYCHVTIVDYVASVDRAVYEQQLCN